MRDVAIFDADGTLYENFSIFPLYDTFAEEGFIHHGDSERLQEVLALYNSGSIDYHTFAVDTLQVAAEVLEGRRLEAANSTSEAFFADEAFTWFGYVAPAMKELTEVGAAKILITAEPQFIARGISAAIGMSNHYSSRFGVESDGTFAGNVLSVLGSSQKGDITEEVVRRVRHSVGLGNSEGDIGMLEIVGWAVCIRPTDTLRSHALERDWTIIDDPDQPLSWLQLDRET